MSIPSLRQKQINEVLDYHRLINRTVFDRNVKSVHLSNQAKAEPHRTDIETEANLRERVDKMKTILQQIIQFTSYGETSIDPDTSGESKEGTMEGRTIDTSAAFLKSKRDTALASLLSEYNGICGLYDLKNRAHVFSESESTALAGIVRELKEPLTTTIGTLMTNKGKNTSYFQYYRVIKTVMENIDSAPPFIKIQPSLLTEPYFIPDPSKVKVVDAPLWKHMVESREQVITKLQEYQTLVASSETEKQAKQKAIYSLTKVLTRIDDLIKTNKKALRNDTSGSYAQASANTESLSSLFADKTIPSSIRKKISELHAAFENADAALEDVDDPEEVEKMFNLFFENPAGSEPYTEKINPKNVADSDKLTRIGLEEDRVNLERTISDLKTELAELFARRTPGDADKLKQVKDDIRSKNKILDDINKELEKSPPSSEDELYDLYDEDFTTSHEPFTAQKDDSVTRQFEREINALTKKIDYEKKIRPRSTKIVGWEDQIYDLLQQFKAYHQLPQDRPTIDREGNQILYDRDGRAYYISYVDGDEVPTYYGPGEVPPRPTGYKYTPKGKGKPRKKGGNDFADDSVLAPYLTKRLKPSKFHKPIKPSESSSESESDMEPDHVTSSDESEVGGRRRKKKAVNPNAFIKQGKEGMALLEKIMAKPRGGRKKAVKPLIDNKRDADMWFM